MVEVDRQFRLDPLIPILLEEETFFVLALDIHGVRLYEGNRGSLRPVALNGLHLHAPSTPILERHDAQEYCREIDRAIQSRLGNKDKPLVLAGNHTLVALYQELNTYPHLIEDPIICDSGAVGVGLSLHYAAQARLKAAQARHLDQALDEYRNTLASARTASGITDIVPCARVGCIEHLFVRKGHVQWGTYNPDTGKVVTTPVPMIQSENLINLAILKTLLNHGRVHLVPGEEMPEGADIAALCRF